MLFLWMCFFATLAIGTKGQDFNLGDALDDDVPTKAPTIPKVPGDPATPKPPPKVDPGKNAGTGGGSFGDEDLLDVGNDGSYQPEGGRGRAADPASGGGAEEPQAAGSSQIAGIVSAVGVALLGAASSYFAYQKKKLCFKIQGGDPESGIKGTHGTQAEPQVLSNLLRTS